MMKIISSFIIVLLFIECDASGQTLRKSIQEKYDVIHDYPTDVPLLSVSKCLAGCDSLNVVTEEQHKFHKMCQNCCTGAESGDNCEKFLNGDAFRHMFTTPAPTTKPTPSPTTAPPKKEKEEKEKKPTEEPHTEESEKEHHTVAPPIPTRLRLLCLRDCDKMVQVTDEDRQQHQQCHKCCEGSESGDMCRVYVPWAKHTTVPAPNTPHEETNERVSSAMKELDILQQEEEEARKCRHDNFHLYKLALNKTENAAREVHTAMLHLNKSATNMDGLLEEKEVLENRLNEIRLPCTSHDWKDETLKLQALLISSEKNLTDVEKAAHIQNSQCIDEETDYNTLRTKADDLTDESDKMYSICTGTYDDGNGFTTDHAEYSHDSCEQHKKLKEEANSESKKAGEQFQKLLKCQADRGAASAAIDHWRKSCRILRRKLAEAQKMQKPDACETAESKEIEKEIAELEKRIAAQKKVTEKQKKVVEQKRANYQDLTSKVDPAREKWLDCKEKHEKAFLAVKQQRSLIRDMCDEDGIPEPAFPVILEPVEVVPGLPAGWYMGEITYKQINETIAAANEDLHKSEIKLAEAEMQQRKAQGDYFLSVNSTESNNSELKIAAKNYNEQVNKITNLTNHLNELNVRHEEMMNICKNQPKKKTMMSELNTLLDRTNHNITAIQTEEDKLEQRCGDRSDKDGCSSRSQVHLTLVQLKQRKSNLEREISDAKEIIGHLNECDKRLAEITDKIKEDQVDIKKANEDLKEKSKLLQNEREQKTEHKSNGEDPRETWLEAKARTADAAQKILQKKSEVDAIRRASVIALEEMLEEDRMEVNKAKDQVDQAKVLMDKSCSITDDTDSMTSDTLQDVEKARNEYAASAEELQDKEKELHDLEQKLQEESDKCENISNSEKIKMLNDRLNKVKSSKDYPKEDFDRLAEKCHEVKEEYNALKTKAESAQKEVQQLYTKCASIMKDSNSTKIENDDSDECKNYVLKKTELDSTTSKANALYKDVQANEAQLKEADDAMKNKSETIATIEKELADVNNEAKQICNKKGMIELENQIGGARERVSNNRNSMDQKQRDLDSLIDQQKHYQQSQQPLLKRCDYYKKQYEVAQQREHQAELLQVETEHELESVRPVVRETKDEKTTLFYVLMWLLWLLLIVGSIVFILVLVLNLVSKDSVEAVKRVLTFECCQNMGNSRSSPPMITSPLMTRPPRGGSVGGENV
eukprot:GHVL01013991.1.p1 GENE.GHVL01013991.1~~GHVL01013991.1.p1  ORF type:complete len:1214 (-),score=308.87 GHVL01013991.1:4406-8047(-)